MWFFLFKGPHDLGVSWSYFVSSFLGRGLIITPGCSHCRNNNLIIDPCLWNGRVFSPLATEFRAWVVSPSQKGRSCGKHFKLASQGPDAHQHGLFSVCFYVCFVFLDGTIIQLTPSVSCSASVIAHNWSQRYVKVHLISMWLGVGYSPVPPTRTAHCPALPPSTFASTRDLSISLWTFITCYDFSIAGWLDREQIRILQSSLY